MTFAHSFNPGGSYVTNTPRAGEGAEQSKARTREARDAYKIETTVLPPKPQAPVDPVVHAVMAAFPGTVRGTQVGGDHYTAQKIQPIEYIWANGLGFSEGNVVKYVTRWKRKGGIKDLRKAHHHLALLIEEAERAEREDGVKYGLQG